MTGDRRDFFRHLGRGLVSTMYEAVGGVREAISTDAPAQEPPPPRPWVRPPGALPEDRFKAVCTQCTDCQQACPYDAIRRLGPEWGPDARTPAIIPTESPCYLCIEMPCITACAPHALLSTPRHEVAMGLAVIEMASCYAAQGQPCDYCVVKCPLGKDAIRFDADKIPVVDPAGCTGCGVCAYLCPAPAIHIEPASAAPR